MRGRTRIIGVPALASTLAVTVILGGAIEIPAAQAATDARAATRTAECQGDWLPNTPTSEEIMNGRISFLDLDPVRVGKDVNWHLNPYKNRSWAMVFHSLRWMGRLVADYETTGRTAYLTRATEIAKDWVHDNPRGGSGTSPYAWAEHPIALRAPALVCLSMHVKADWLTRTLVEHAKVLSNPALYEKGHNHGMDQDIALLRIGCRYGHKEWSGLAALFGEGGGRAVVSGAAENLAAPDRLGEARHRRPGRTAGAGPPVRPLRARAPRGRHGRHQGLRAEGAGRDHQTVAIAGGIHRSGHPAERLPGAHRRRRRRPPAAGRT